MDLEALRDLIRASRKAGITSMHLENESESLKIVLDEVPPARRKKRSPEVPPTEPVPPPTVHGNAIKAEKVGVFRSRYSNMSSDFVKKDKKVREGDILGIIDVVGVIHEISSRSAGVIDDILVKNGQAVEYGQPLFTVRDK